MSRWLIPAMLLLITACGEDTTVLELGFVDTESVAVVPVPPPPPPPAPSPPTLVPCTDVALLAGPGDGPPSGPISLDQEVVGALQSYADGRRDSFAGLWLDGASTGGVVLAFVPPIEGHRQEILAAIGLDPANPSFTLVEAAFSLADLEAARVEVLGLGMASIDGATIDQRRNRVTVQLVDPTAADLDRLTGAVELDQVCTDVLNSPPRPAGPLEVLPRPGADRLLTCGDMSFPASALVDRRRLDSIDHPAAGLFAEFTVEPDGEGTGGAGEEPEWIVLAIDAEQAYFGQFDGELVATALAASDGSQWAVSGWSFGCDLRVGFPEGLERVNVFLDPAFPPRPETTTLRLLVSEADCGRGRAMGDRLLTPEIAEGDEVIAIAFAVAERAHHPDPEAECPANPLAPVTVRLAAPLGARTVSDGTFIPARPLRPPGG